MYYLIFKKHIKEEAMKQKWILTPRQRCDLEMLLVGGFAPLSGFLSHHDYENVVLNQRLTTGQIWPIPITLDVNEEFAEKVSLNDVIELCDIDNTLLARIRVTDKWKPNKEIEAQKVFGTKDTRHPAVDYLFNQAGCIYLGGPVELVQVPKHYDFPELRHTPESLKQLFSQLGLQKIIGFQTRNPMHQAHMKLTMRAAEQIDGHILLHPVVGLTKPGDIDSYTRVRCYQKIMHYFCSQNALLSLLPLAMRMAGPREALWHAIIRKNYGCTHFIVGRDHAGPGNDSQNKPFYDPNAAQKYVCEFQNELGIEIIPFAEMVYVKERKIYCLPEEIQPNETILTISGTELRERLMMRKPIPDWFSFPEIIEELRKTYPLRHKQGLTLFFTGLSGSGKSTLAQALIAKLMSFGKINITLLDGDVIRRIISNELGFSRRDRDLNINRLGFIASEVTKAGGIVICAAIAPYQKARMEARKLVSQYGGFIEIYLSTPLKLCSERDPKGLYAKAQSGQIKGMTGVDDPYEPPKQPEISIDTSLMSIEQSIDKIMEYLCEESYFSPTDSLKVEGMS